MCVQTCIVLDSMKQNGQLVVVEFEQHIWVSERLRGYKYNNVFERKHFPKKVYLQSSTKLTLND